MEFQGPTPGRWSPRPLLPPLEREMGRATDQSTHVAITACDWSMALFARGEHATIFSMMLGQLSLLLHGSRMQASCLTCFSLKDLSFWPSCKGSLGDPVPLTKLQEESVAKKEKKINKIKMEWAHMQTGPSGRVLRLSPTPALLCLTSYWCYWPCQFDTTHGLAWY